MSAVSELYTASACRAVQYAHTSRYLCMLANMDLILCEQNIAQNKPENNFVEDTMKMEATQMVQNTVSSGGQPSRLLSRQQTQLGGTEMCIRNSSTSFPRTKHQMSLFRRRGKFSEGGAYLGDSLVQLCQGMQIIIIQGLAILLQCKGQRSKVRKAYPLRCPWYQAKYTYYVTSYKMICLEIRERLNLAT